MFSERDEVTLDGADSSWIEQRLGRPVIKAGLLGQLLR
jgi:hypothetical protein